jgi:hypothetical protein
MTIWSRALNMGFTAASYSEHDRHPKQQGIISILMTACKGRRMQKIWVSKSNLYRSDTLWYAKYSNVGTGVAPNVSSAKTQRARSL